jgi:Gluconate 2-dehydrogenase subunit 3
LGSRRTSTYSLSEDQIRFFKALCESIVPAGENSQGDPGAVTVGGLDYIDSVLADSSEARQAYFQGAISKLNDLCDSKYGRAFADLDSEKRDNALKDFFLNPATREQMFDLRSIALEAFYSDFKTPAYGGVTGWEYTEFGGKRISDLKKDWSFLRIWKERANK